MPEQSKFNPGNWIGLDCPGFSKIGQYFKRFLNKHNQNNHGSSLILKLSR